MNALPSSTVTFLFTDIEGSTKLAQQYPNAMRDQIGDHRPHLEQASVDKDLAMIRSQLRDDEFAKLSTEGHAMTTEQVIALALEENLQ